MSTTMTPSPEPPPPPALKPTFDKHLDAVKWVIGLPVAILFGTTQFIDKIDFSKHPGASRLLTWIVIVSALTAVLSVFYYFVAIKLADYKVLSKPAPTSLEILGSTTYYGSLILFVAAFVLTVIGLVLYPGVQLDKNPPPTPVAAVPHFTITTSGPVKDRRGTHVHTFLFDQATGEVWKMECSSTSGVHFVRVPAQDLPANAKLAVK
jgi:hypothetical protein